MMIGAEYKKGNEEGGVSPTELRRVVSGHMPALDGLRGIAILLVLVIHFTWSTVSLAGPSGILLLSIADSGWTGVELFFVLSGFLITGILLESKGAENYLSSFYIRRALRILPLSYAALFFWFILCPLFGKMGVPFLPKAFSAVQLWYWFYVGNWTSPWGGGDAYFRHFWSLAVEEQFYLVWPFVIMIASRRTLARICVALILIGPLLRVLLYLNGVDGDKIHRITTSHLDVLSLGALAALIVRDENWVRRLTPRLSYFAYPCLITFCVLGVVPRSFSYDRAAFIYGNLPLGIFFAALLLRAVTTSNLRSRLQRFLQAEWLRSFGKYSYAIYVLHWPLARLYFDTILPHLTRKLRGTPLRSWFLHPGIFGGVTLIILFIIHIVAPCLFFFGLGKFSWWAFEGPINGLKRYFNPRWRSSIPKPVET